MLEPVSFFSLFTCSPHEQSIVMTATSVFFSSITTVFGLGLASDREIIVGFGKSVHVNAGGKFGKHYGSYRLQAELHCRKLYHENYRRKMTYCFSFFLSF